MKEIEKYVGYYLLVYLVVLAFCGFFQYMYACQGQSLSCAFSKEGFNTIITTTAYVLTPIVAIIGFLNWKKQHNKLILANEAKELLIAVNYDIELMSNISGFIREMDHHLLFKDLNLDIFVELYDHIYAFNTNTTPVASKCLILHELNNDQCLATINSTYQNLKIFFYKKMLEIVDLESNCTIGDLLNCIDKDIETFLSANQNYKKELRNYIIAK